MFTSLDNLIFTAICMLLGTEDTDFTYYETDPDWWLYRLYTRRN